jgi:hypothetical protein
MEQPLNQTAQEETAQDQSAQDTRMPDTHHGEGGSTRLPAWPEQHAARMQCIQKYQVHALHKDDYLEANLGSVNAGLIRMAINLEEALERSMTADPLTVERLQRLLPIIEVQLRVTRQIDRYAHLEQQIAQARKAKESLERPAMRGVARSLSEEPSLSEDLNS